MGALCTCGLAISVPTSIGLISRAGDENFGKRLCLIRSGFLVLKLRRGAFRSRRTGSLTCIPTGPPYAIYSWQKI